MTHQANTESTRSILRGVAGSLRPIAKTCSAPSSLSWGGATARKGGDSPAGPFPGPSSNGVFPDPKAGAATSFATPAVRVPFPGTRARKEHRGRSIQRSRFSQPRAWAARADSFPLITESLAEIHPGDAQHPRGVEGEDSITPDPSRALTPRWAQLSPPSIRLTLCTSNRVRLVEPFFSREGAAGFLSRSNYADLRDRGLGRFASYPGTNPSGGDA